MKATVIIPNYNGLKYLKNCLTSLCASTLKPEIIVVDNGSSDGSLELTKRDFPEVKLIELGENTGFCLAVNEGIRAAHTEYVILLNNDTQAHPNMVQELVQAMDKKKDAFSAQAKMITMQNHDILDDAGDFYCALGWAYARGKGKPANRYNSCGRIFAACGGAAIYRRRIMEELGCLDENHFAYLEDIDIGYRARAAGYHNYYIPEAVVYHAGSASSGSRYNEFKARLSSRNSIYLIYKNMPLLQILINLPFLIPGMLIKIIFYYRKGLGNIYVKGMLEGLKLSLSPEGKRHKLPFSMKNAGHYAIIQWELWVNLLRRFIQN